MPPWTKDIHVYLTQGLEGTDDQIDLLLNLFEQSQTATVETANPMLDLLSFVQDCSKFWVINASDRITQPNEAPLSEWPPEENTNSLGLYPSNPSHSIQPTPSILEGTDSTLIEPSIVDPGRRRRFSDYLDNVLVPSSSTTLQYNPYPPIQEQSHAGYLNNNQDRLSTAQEIAGFVYLVPSSAFPDALHFEEYNIGIILFPKWRGKGVAERALHLALDQTFSEHNVHRVQAQLIDCFKNDKPLTLFTRMGFSHEGTRRQGFHCPLTVEWKDITTLALLVTDWFLHVRDRTHGFRSAPKSLWDALFARHQKEREELLRWQDKRPFRSSSLETIRDSAATPIQGIPRLGDSDASDSDVGTASESEISAVERPKRKLFEIGDGKTEDASDAYDASSSEYDSEYESAVEGSPPKRLRSRERDPGSPITSAEAVDIDWLRLASPLGDMHIFSDADERNEAHRAGSTRTFARNVCLKTEPDDVLGEPTGTSHHAHESSAGRVPSPSPSTEPREGSVISVPPSESESEFELDEVGYSTSSSTDSSSPPGWELVDSDEDLPSIPYAH